MTSYAIREVNKTLTEIAKFPSGEDTPTEVYRIMQTYNSTVCNCPAYTADCKHIKMLKRWLTLKPSDRLGAMFNDKTNKFFNLITEDDIKELLK